MVDETFVGGAPKNRHRQGRASRLPSGVGSRKGPVYDKTPVVALISKETGEARTRVVADVTGATLRKAIAQDVDMPNTVLHTDGHSGYKWFRAEMAGHEYVDHSAYEYVRGDVSTNMAESFFAQFKRSVDGTFHNVSRQHLSRYADEIRLPVEHQQDDRRPAGPGSDRQCPRAATHLPATEGRLNDLADILGPNVFGRPWSPFGCTALRFGRGPFLR